MIDNTGKKLTKESVENCVVVVKKHMGQILKLPPELAVEMLTIKLALEELLEYKSKCGEE
jgi:hypothetical protein